MATNRANWVSEYCPHSQLNQLNQACTMINYTVIYTSKLSLVYINKHGRPTGASPRGGLGWTCPPHFCQRSFLILMQIRWVFTRKEGDWGLCPVPHWGLSPQTPDIGSYSMHSPCMSIPHFLTWRCPCRPKELKYLKMFYSATACTKLANYGDKQQRLSHFAW